MNQITIGRNSQSTIVVPQQYNTVSGNHATISKNGNSYILEDHSTNGTYVNGNRIHNGSCQIRQGDQIMFGQQYPLKFSDVEMHLGSSSATQRMQVAPETARIVTPPQEQRGTPHCINEWNWGAFLLGWIWGIGNGIYWPIVSLVPIVGQVAALVIMFVLGVNGSKYAWDVFHGTAEEFDKKQELWTKAGWIYLIVIIVLSSSIALLSLA